MMSNKPYLVRAFYEWINDNNCTPYVLVNADHPRCKVPTDYIQNGQITLNVSPRAVRDLKISNETLEFRASFSGVVHFVSAPIKSILAIYAQENQQGMFFDYEDGDDAGAGEIEQQVVPEVQKTETQPQAQAQAKTRPNHLRLVD